MISLPTGVWGGSDSRHNFAEWPNARAVGAPDGREHLGEHLPGAAVGYQFQFGDVNVGEVRRLGGSRHSWEFIPAEA